MGTNLPEGVVAAAVTVTQALDEACAALCAHRKKSVLVLYYPAMATMSEDDLADVYAVFRDASVTPEEKLASIDVLIDSYGGDPVAGYRLAQLIRNFAKEVFFIVPDHAYSAATLLCFSANQIRLGHFAGLSPIDITLVHEGGKTPRQEVELANVDSFLEFAKRARKSMEEMLRQMGSSGSTNVDSELLVAMVKEVGFHQVGKFFRERTVTGYYAEELLSKYMFGDASDCQDRVNKAVHHFLFGTPAHDFHLDYHLCAKQGLAVVEMNTIESDLAKAVVIEIENLVRKNVICHNLPRKRKMPFFRFYPLVQKQLEANNDANNS